MKYIELIESTANSLMILILLKHLFKVTKHSIAVQKSSYLIANLVNENSFFLLFRLCSYLFICLCFRLTPSLFKLSINARLSSAMNHSPHPEH